MLSTTLSESQGTVRSLVAKLCLLVWTLVLIVTSW